MRTVTKIPIVESGTKYRTQNGISATKNGIKKGLFSSEQLSGGKPAWLRVQMPAGRGYADVLKNVREHGLSTVCEESMCPNIGECWNNGTATIMVMGSVCTRACRFCAVDTGNPRGWLDSDEPENTARSVELMALKYVVLTSVDRDDLPDGGASHYAECIRAVKKKTPATVIEALTPDFNGCERDVETVVSAGPDVFAQNLETVCRLTQSVRDPRASYQQTLSVLSVAKRLRSALITKTSLMLGLGETDEEILAAMEDLRQRDVDILTLGQYLRPTLNHLPVVRYVPPREFDHYRALGLSLGFLEVVAGPLVRSSYRADRTFNQNNVGLSA